ncbi:MAG: hypothetical protein V6Z89_18930 [Desulfobacter sp.]
MTANRIAFFLAGAVVGAAGMAFATSPKGKKIISDVIEGGTGLKENIATRMETLKEDIEDYVAETKFNRARKKDAGADEHAPDDASSADPA